MVSREAKDQIRHQLRIKESMGLQTSLDYRNLSKHIYTWTNLGKGSCGSRPFLPIMADLVALGLLRKDITEEENILSVSKIKAYE